MQYSATTVRLETGLKQEFDSICKSMGMNANVAFNIFVRAVVNKRGIPFPVESSEKKDRAAGLAAFNTIRKQAETGSHTELSDVEIEQEISEYRSGK